MREHTEKVSSAKNIVLVSVTGPEDAVKTRRVAVKFSVLALKRLLEKHLVGMLTGKLNMTFRRSLLRAALG